MKPTATSLNKHDATLGNSKASAYFFLSQLALLQKFNNLQNLLAIKRAKRSIIAIFNPIGVNRSDAAFSGRILHVVKASSLKNVVGINAMSIVAGVAGFMSRLNRAFMKNEARNVSTNNSGASPTPANDAILFSLRPNPTAVRFGDFFNEASRQCGRAIDGFQKFWRDVVGVKSPLNEFVLSHA